MEKTDFTDYMVCFALETTWPATNCHEIMQPFRKLKIEQGELGENSTMPLDLNAAIQAEKVGGAFLPKTIQMDWCICSVRDNFKAEKVSSIFINSGEPLSNEMAE